MANIKMIRIATGTPLLKVSNVEYNEGNIKTLISEAEKEGCGILLLPELTITGATSSDLFRQELLYAEQLKALTRISAYTNNLSLTLIIGCYIKLKKKLYSCAAVIKQGKIYGIVPKMNISDENSRWFSSGKDISLEISDINLLGENIPFGNLLFTDTTSEFSFAIELGEDLYEVKSIGTNLSTDGAHIIFNPSATIEIVGASNYRKTVISAKSGMAKCAYVYASAGISESTTDFVFSGHQIIAENGLIIAENNRFERDNNLTISEIDYGKLDFERHTNSNNAKLSFTEVNIDNIRVIDSERDVLVRTYLQNPFIPENIYENCREIFKMQSIALAKRMEHIGLKKTIIGISGGLDSTLALLVAVETHKLLNLPTSNILAITMPGFGTTGKTYNNALTIMKLLGADIREISIADAVRKHFQDIGHDENIHDLTYENAQARERTQILMDVAGKENALLVGTGDLSELALGWCTYNGDHMAMYGVNAGIPKTLVRFVVKWIMENKLSGSSEDATFSSDNALLKATLQDILDTPISPELLPPDKSGEIAQKTEDKVGPYDLHDFFIFHTLRSGMDPEKLFFIAKQVFVGKYEPLYILKWMKTFYWRFFSQQFKRSCMPDGPKIGSIGLSPRGDLKMASDANSALWIKATENIEKRFEN